ncbi:MAG: hypothetical protein [Olavius algarvensis Delta 4 endosymbiont]|nr:MAG: hypothetical protein [Olavius algarvensis Delta 4 endosymbiont]
MQRWWFKGSSLIEIEFGIGIEKKVLPRKANPISILIAIPISMKSTTDQLG